MKTRPEYREATKEGKPKNHGWLGRSFAFSDWTELLEITPLRVSTSLALEIKTGAPSDSC